ncbi:MAG: hypothetical protein ACKOTD_03075, partial [Phycisphaerales bacterium]
QPTPRATSKEDPAGSHATSIPTKGLAGGRLMVDTTHSGAKRQCTTGIDVAWEPAGSSFDVALGVGWQQRRFRLGANADPTINNGVGLDQSWAMFVSVGADLAPGLRIDGLVGCQFLEYLELQDSQGNAHRNATVDPNALLGVFVTWTF